MAGTRKDLTDSVNVMANNLLTQVRNIAEVTIAVAERASFAQDAPVDVRGEILPAQENHQHDGGAASFVWLPASPHVSRAKVGTVKVVSVCKPFVPGVAGHVERFDGFRQRGGSANLTAQVRNIAEVTTAVAYDVFHTQNPGGCEKRGNSLNSKTSTTMVDKLNGFLPPK